MTYTCATTSTHTRARDQLGWLGCDVATVVSRAARCAANQPTTVLLRIQQPSNLLYDGVVVLRSTGVSCVSHYAVVSPQVVHLYAMLCLKIKSYVCGSVGRAGASSAATAAF